MIVFSRGTNVRTIISLVFALSQYSKALYASFYSSILYSDVVKRWQGLGLGYLLFLIILGPFPLSGRVIVNLIIF